MTSQQETSIVERLCNARSPRNYFDWEEQEGYYITACRASGEDIPQLIDIVRKWSDPEWLSSESGLDRDLDGIDLLPVTAWRTLADLKSAAAVQPLIDMLCELDDEFDDWVSEELPHVFGKIGEPAIEPLVLVAQDAGTQEFVRSIAVRGLRCVAKYHEEARNQITAYLTEMMADSTEDSIQFNTTVLVELVDLRAVDAAEAIERAFANDFLDIGMMGKWEDVRQALGVESLGLEMPRDPYNSLEDLTKEVGIGIFSTQPIFMFGEIDEDAEQAYYERAWDLFSNSNEAQQVIDSDGELGWFRLLLEFGLNYLGETIDMMTVASLTEFVFEYVPRKVSTEPEAADSIVFELTKFWEYLDRAFEVPDAKSIIEWLNTEGVVGRLKSELSDPKNFGMAKSFFMSGMDAGYDMTSETEMAEFVEAYNNSSLPSNNVSAPETTVSRGERIGRNDPCPCGSGKKYKKCCR
ncbi:DUF1186 domain-containing protein [Bythopirellula polymerisocia]|uniref:Preprotein translocase subunit SecA n=1 Tax=Bythopirellula polymerisocia TaxID=2528003 RepID=A0A5C6D250_9BACT|nr:DUF1186 domain-containing protein [Bythopirellula polymerisocia]TWU29924.1 hypothetical protein Pla144_07050 [Bythopirellula polymerisocia]